MPCFIELCLLTSETCDIFVNFGEQVLHLLFALKYATLFFYFDLFTWILLPAEFITCYKTHHSTLNEAAGHEIMRIASLHWNPFSQFFLLHGKLWSTVWNSMIGMQDLLIWVAAKGPLKCIGSRMRPTGCQFDTPVLCHEKQYLILK
jgi:hypothetical protein